MQPIGTLNNKLSDLYISLFQSDYAGMSDDGTVAQDEEARHAAEIAAEKRKQAQDVLREQLLGTCLINTF